MHRIIQDAFAEIARQIRATNHDRVDIAQFMLIATRKKGWTGANDSGGETRNAASALHADKRIRIANQARRFRVDRCGYETEQAGRSRDGPNLDWLRWRIVPEEYSRIFNIVREAPRFGGRFRAQEYRAGNRSRRRSGRRLSWRNTRAGFGEQFTHRTGHSIAKKPTVMA